MHYRQYINDVSRDKTFLIHYNFNRKHVSVIWWEQMVFDNDQPQTLKNQALTSGKVKRTFYTQYTGGSRNENKAFQTCRICLAASCNTVAEEADTTPQPWGLWQRWSPEREVIADELWREGGKREVPRKEDGDDDEGEELELEKKGEVTRKRMESVAAAIAKERISRKMFLLLLLFLSLS